MEVAGNPLGGLFTVCTLLLICPDMGAFRRRFSTLSEGSKGPCSSRVSVLPRCFPAPGGGTAFCVPCITPGLVPLLLGRLLYFSSANTMPADMKVAKIGRCLLKRRVKSFFVVFFLAISAGCRGGGKGNETHSGPSSVLVDHCKRRSWEA